MTGLTKDGQAVASSSYNLYGARKTSTDTTGNPFAYNGEARDDTGLDYLRARYYDSQGGTFLTEDSYPGEDTDPLSQNRYSYVQNNPVNYTDPSGHRMVWMGGEGEPSRPRSINTRLQRFYQRSIVEQDSLGRAVSLREYTDRRIQTDRNFRAPASYYQAFGPNVATYQSSYAYAQQQAERARAQAEQRRRQQIRYEYGLATGQNSSPTIREGLNLYRNWNTSLQNTLKHVCTTAERVKSQVVDFVKNVDWKKVAVTAAAIGVGIALTVATGGLGAPVAMAIGGAASGAIISGYDAYSSGQRGWELVGSIAKGAGTGAISGLIGGQFVGAGASLATNVTQSISNQAVRQVAKIGVESAVETAIDTGIDLATGNKITGQTVAMNFAFNTFTNGAGSVSPKKAPKADVVTTKPTGGRLPMTVDNLQMFAEKSKVNLVTSKNNHFNNWLNKGSSDNSVYYGINANTGDAVYTGITKQGLESRLYQHNRQGKNFSSLDEQYSDLTRNQARAVEQYLIENRHANKLNKINSISPKNKMYDEAMKWAEKYLNGGN